MWKQIGQVLYTDPERASLGEGSAWVGRAAVLVDAGRFQPTEQAWMAKTFGISPHARYAIPLLGPDAVELPGITILPTVLPPRRLSGITSDRMLYRQGCDEVHLFVLDFLTANRRRKLSILSGGTIFTQRSVTLDAAGLATLSLIDLPAGDYRVDWADAPDVESACQFTVAEYRMVPLVASLARRQVYGDPPRLSVILRLNTFGKPVTGRVRLRLTDQGYPVESTIAEAKKGTVYASFRLAGEGPHAIEVQMADDASRTASVPIIGSRKQDRQLTIVSRMGAVVAGSLLPMHDANEVRGLFLAEQGIESSPVLLERADARTVRLRMAAAAEAVCVQIVDPYRPPHTDAPVDVAMVRRDHMAPGDTIELEHRGPVGWLTVAAFVDGEPWEGWATIIAPSRLEPRIHLPEHPAPDQEIKIHLETADCVQAAYLIVKDSRLPASDTPTSRLAHAIKRDIESTFGDMKPQRPPAAMTQRDPIGVLLLEGVISRDQMLDAMEYAQRKDVRPIAALIDMGYVTAQEALKVIARFRGCDYADLTEITLPWSILEQVSESVARENAVLPLGERDGVLRVAISDPDDFDTLEKLRFILGRRIEVVLASRDAILEAIDRLYGQVAGEAAESMLLEFADTAVDFCETIGLAQEPEPPAADRQLLGAHVGGPDVFCSGPRMESGGAEGQDPPADRLIDEAAVLFAGLLPVCGGHATATVRLGSGLGEYLAEVFVVSDSATGLDWARAEARFRPAKDPFVAIELPRFVATGDGAEGRLHVGAASGLVHAKVTRDGQEISLTLDGSPIAPDQVLETHRETLRFLATPGQYEATVKDAASGKVERVSGRVNQPGKFRRVRRPLRILQPGERVSREEEPGIVTLRVLPGLDRPIRALVDATGGYEHHCCEQTAAKLLAAVSMYLTAGDDLTRQRRAEEIFLAGVRRERSMWLPGRGFKIYPDAPDQPDSWCGPMASRHLHYVELLRGTDSGGQSVELQRAVDEAGEMARDTAAAYKLDWPPENPSSPHAAYAAVRFGRTTSVRTAAVEWVRRQVYDGKLPRWAGDAVPGAVGVRAFDAYAAATLLRGGSPADLPAALRLANGVVRQLGPEGRLYSTFDSVAAIAMMTELQAAHILGTSGEVALDGVRMPLAEAIVTADGATSVQALGDRVTVELTELVDEDWAAFSDAVRMDLAMEKDGRHTTQFRPAETLDLVVTLHDGYQPGDLLWVCLPDSLSRVFGGGQIKQFAVDFAGGDTVRVPLVTTGLTSNSQGQPEPHRFAVCLRNMFQEERSSNPGLLEIVVQP